MVRIRHAVISEKEKTYEWLCLSDTACLHMGKPDYPESPIPDWNEFQDDFKDFYYLEDGRKQGSVLIMENNQEEIGCLCYACFHLQPNIAEVDIWLKEKKYCGKGFGPQALQLLMCYLTKTLGVESFIIRPSGKNSRAIAAYKKAGFVCVVEKEKIVKKYFKDEYIEKYGAGDYGFENTAVMIAGKENTPVLIQ